MAKIINNLINAKYGDILYFDGNDWTRLEPGQDGYALVTHGEGFAPTWGVGGGGGGGGGGNPSGPAGGDLSGTYPDPQVIDFHLTGQTAGSIVYYNGTNWVPLPIGPNNYFLSNDGTKPVWKEVVIPPPPPPLPVPTQIGQFLYCSDSDLLEFKPELPVVNDEEGFILTNDDGYIVVV